MQHLLLQGVEAPQADLAFFLAQPLLLRLLQALLLGLPQLQVENLQTGRSGDFSPSRPWPFSFYIPQALRGLRIFRWAQGRKRTAQGESHGGTIWAGSSTPWANTPPWAG